MNIESAKFHSDEAGVNNIIVAVIDDVKMSVPLSPDNRHYAEILRQVAAGELTIADAD